MIIQHVTPNKSFYFAALTDV